MVETSEVYDFSYIKSLAESLYSTFSDAYSRKYANLERKERFKKSVRLSFSLSHLPEDYFSDFESALSKVISDKKTSRERTELESSLKFRNTLYHNLSLDEIVEKISNGVFESMKRFYKKSNNKSKFSFDRRFIGVFNDYLIENNFKISDKEKIKFMKIVRDKTKSIWNEMHEQDFLKKQNKKQRVKLRRQVKKESDLLAQQRRDDYWESLEEDFFVSEWTFKPQKKSRKRKTEIDKRQWDLIDLIDKLNS